MSEEYDYLHIHQVDDLEIDLPALNMALMANQHAGFGAIYEQVLAEPGFVGPFQMVEGELRIAEIDDGPSFLGYSDNTLVGSCFYDDEAKLIAKHITKGKLVLRVAPDGYDDEYWVLTPNKSTKKAAPDVRF